MKPSVNLVSFRWTLFLSACLALTVSADCGTDCAYCSMYLRLQQTDINNIACVLQCQGLLTSGGSWSLCQGLLQTAVSTPDAAPVSRESTPNPQHQEEKKYGGFMRRYGGFMKRYGGFMKRYGGFMKKTAELYGLEPDDVDRSREILSKSDVDMLANQVEDDGEREEAAMRNTVNVKGGPVGLEGVAKRYGGFMRRGYASEGGARPLEKRYGGFMRRVGRPEWEESKRYGGFLQRSPQEEEEEESSEMEKRYGGFMGY
ncbi:proenkephalin b [Brachyhypopomus gauderio]|uniref:proenkephalin b n=1 Tax=Brachyhypopomus gauderio TaxID=698409 RepID=UPI0040434D49